jgi:hypothetical protein
MLASLYATLAAQGSLRHAVHGCARRSPKGYSPALQAVHYITWQAGSLAQAGLRCLASYSGSWGLVALLYKVYVTVHLASVSRQVEPY